jgi:regulator of vacuolar morphogenesis
MPYTLKIPSTEITANGDSAKPFTVYHVVLETPLRTQTLQKRYSDFEALHKELISSVGAPPAPLPAKSWFARTVNNPELTEERRRGLEAYVSAIESSPDSKWRTSTPYRSFLGFSITKTPGEGKRRSVIEEEALGPAAKPVMTSHQWLDMHNDLKNHVQSARLALARRDQATSVTLQHEAGAQAKKWLVKAHTLTLRLDDGLRGLSEGRDGVERLGDGEVRRRRDLLSRARKERDALEGVLNSFVTRSSAGRAPSPEYGKPSRSGSVSSGFP